MLQKTFIASTVQPWLGSIQYSPAERQNFISPTLSREEPLLPHEPCSNMTARQTYRSSSRGGRASGLCRSGQGSSSCRLDCGCPPSGCSGISAWHPPLHRAGGHFRRPGLPSCTSRGQDPSQDWIDQRKLTCRCRALGGQEDRGDQDSLGGPEEKQRMNRFTVKLTTLRSSRLFFI